MMIQLVIGVAGLLFVIASATLQSTSVYIDDKALFFVVAVAFFYTLAIGGDRWKMIELADIADRETRDLVPYSLRHFMITQRIMSGLTFRQIADMCGTSVAQIEKTYYHLNDEIRLTNAVADYRRREDGTIEVL